MLLCVIRLPSALLGRGAGTSADAGSQPASAFCFLTYTQIRERQAAHTGLTLPAGGAKVCESVRFEGRSSVYGWRISSSGQRKVVCSMAAMRRSIHTSASLEGRGRGT
jgi:hypothetical protein